MTDPTPNPEAPAKRGRFEIRLMMALVLLLLVAAGIYAFVRGPPDAGARFRDSQDYDPYAQPAATQPGPRAAPAALP